MVEAMREKPLGKRALHVRYGVNLIVNAVQARTRMGLKERGFNKFPM